ncbi:MAG TPA: DUF2141 domain-containing protein [Alphaproteobacteria bacterium]|nr:DUF2141 domain-containing protein [Alphaproteobacteria bacterium]
MPARLRLFLLFTLVLLLPAVVYGASKADGRVCAAGDTVRLQIQIAGLRSAKGNVTIMLYGDRDEDYLKKGKRLARVRVPAQMGEVSFCLPVPAPGSYALSLYHDEDGNKKLTKNWLGLPTEGYGFSRNAAVSYRLPQLDEAVFTALPGDTRLRITMRY